MNYLTQNELLGVVLVAVVITTILYFKTDLRKLL